MEHAVPVWTFKDGFKAVMPLWLAAAPFAIVYAAAAKDAGLNPGELQLASLIVFSATTQMAMVQLLTVHASLGAMLVTVLVANLHHIVYSLTLARRFHLTHAERFLAAFFLTDAAFGVAMAATGSVG